MTGSKELNSKAAAGFDAFRVPSKPLPSKGRANSLIHPTVLRIQEQIDLKTSAEQNTGQDFTREISGKTPFFEVIDNLLKERKKYKKNTYNNLLYKFIANSGIGAMGRGLNYKTHFDPSSGQTVPMEPGLLTNPLYGGWVTAFIRTLLTEAIVHHHEAGGEIISCTTDGFLSDSPLDDSTTYGVYSEMFQFTRVLMGSKDFFLETKHVEPKGVFSWRTRGQLGLDGRVSAMTGFNKKGFKIEELLDIVKTKIETDNDKSVFFTQFSIRSGTEILKYGGHVTGKYLEKTFNVIFDSKRVIVRGTGGRMTSIPLNTASDGLIINIVNKLSSSKYSKTSPIQNFRSSSKDSYATLFARSLIRCLFSNPAAFGLEQSLVKRTFVFDLLSSIGKKVTPNYISKQKSGVFIPKSVPKTPQTLEMMKSLKILYPLLDESIF